MELCIDTSTRYASVSCSDKGELLQELTWRSQRNHSVELAPAVETLLARQKVSVKDLEAVFVAKGPGAFSALRVGMSLAKSLSVGAEIPRSGKKDSRDIPEVFPPEFDAQSVQDR